MREERHAAAGRSQTERPAWRARSRISALVRPASASGARDVVLRSGFLAGAKVADIVQIHSVGNGRIVADGGHDIEELVFAMEAPVAAIADVVRIGELVGFGF